MFVYEILLNWSKLQKLQEVWFVLWSHVKALSNFSFVFSFPFFVTLLVEFQSQVKKEVERRRSICLLLFEVMAKKDSDRSLTKLQQKNGTVTDSDLKIPNSKNNKLNHKRKK